MPEQDLLWEPSDAVIASNLTTFARWLRTHHAIDMEDYQHLWQWSI